MKICLFVSSGATGFGGHHFSVRDIFLSMKEKQIDVTLLVAGEIDSKVLNEFDHFFIKLRYPWYFNSINAFKTFFKANDFDTVFCFDENTSRIAILNFHNQLQKVVPVKPGWLNSTSWTNSTNHFVCFSKENFDYMKGLLKYKKVQIHLIPNRVRNVAVDNIFCNNLKKDLSLTDVEKIILAVSRIDPDKKQVFVQSINLFKNLEKHSSAYRLIIAGHVSCNDTLSWLETLIEQQNLGSKVVLLTESLYTKNVSKIFSMADFLIGMGRTAMESMSLGKLTYIPIGNNNLPVLITKDNFEKAFQRNFTYRSEFNDSELQNNHSLLQRFKDHNFIKELENETKMLFEENLSIEKGINAYLEIVKSIKNEKAITKSLIKRSQIFAYSLLKLNYGWLNSIKNRIL